MMPGLYTSSSEDDRGRITASRSSIVNGLQLPSSPSTKYDEESVDELSPTASRVNHLESSTVMRSHEEESDPAEPVYSFREPRVGRMASSRTSRRFHGASDDENEEDDDDDDALEEWKKQRLQAKIPFEGITEENGDSAPFTPAGYDTLGKNRTRMKTDLLHSQQHRSDDSDKEDDDNEDAVSNEAKQGRAESYTRRNRGSDSSGAKSGYPSVNKKRKRQLDDEDDEDDEVVPGEDHLIRQAKAELASRRNPLDVVKEKIAREGTKNVKSHKGDFERDDLLFTTRPVDFSFSFSAGPRSDVHHEVVAKWDVQYKGFGSRIHPLISVVEKIPAKCAFRFFCNMCQGGGSRMMPGGDKPRWGKVRDIIIHMRKCKRRNARQDEMDSLDHTLQVLLDHYDRHVSAKTVVTQSRALSFEAQMEQSRRNILKRSAAELFLGAEVPRTRENLELVQTLTRDILALAEGPGLKSEHVDAIELTDVKRRVRELS